MDEMNMETPTGSQGLEFELVYEGSEVDDGSIGTRDLINALTGMTEVLPR